MNRGRKTNFRMLGTHIIWNEVKGSANLQEIFITISVQLNAENFK